jgi:uncharacterized membrane protein (UPF0127 family)
MPLPRLLALLLLLALAAPAAAQPQTQPQPAFETDTLWIETAGGNRYTFQVELAVTPDEQAQGLMHRESLASDAGMLFLFDPVRPVSFWMKNTLIPLDMLFIASDGRIVRIAERTTPLSTDPVPSGEPVRAVLEVRGGLSSLLGIRPGDRVIHDAFVAQAAP